MLVRLVICLVLLATTVAVAPPAGAASLSGYNIDPGRIAVTGVSSGGFMAVQLHVAYSGTFRAGGEVAGGLYWCAEGSSLRAGARGPCLETPENLNVQRYIDRVKSTSDIDPWTNLTDDKVYLWQNALDATVDPPMGDKTKQFYDAFTNGAALRKDVRSAHSWVTDDYGNACDKQGSPYINRCTVDMSGEMLHHWFGPLKPRVAQKAANLSAYDQPEGYAMTTTQGHLYAPESCRAGATCGLVVALHGCQMESSDIGDKFYVNSGLNTWAESNDLVVLYPQNKYSTSHCWDWWGYSGANYHERSGSQVKAVHNQVATVAGLPRR